jgi:hypothetical protein
MCNINTYSREAKWGIRRCNHVDFPLADMHIIAPIWSPKPPKKSRGPDPARLWFFDGF